MPAIQVATLRTFPEKVVEFVKLGFLLAEIVMEKLVHQAFICDKQIFRLSLSDSTIVSSEP